MFYQLLILFMAILCSCTTHKRIIKSYYHSIIDAIFLRKSFCRENCPGFRNLSGLLISQILSKSRLIVPLYGIVTVNQDLVQFTTVCVTALLSTNVQLRMLKKILKRVKIMPYTRTCSHMILILSGNLGERFSIVLQRLSHYSSFWA